MTRIQWVTHPEPVYVEGKGEFPSRYAPGCFDRLPGQVVPWTWRYAAHGPEGDGLGRGERIGTATIVSVEVNADGSEATWTADFAPGDSPEMVKVIGGLL